GGRLGSKPPGPDGAGVRVCPRDRTSAHERTPREGNGAPSREADRRSARSWRCFVLQVRGRVPAAAVRRAGLAIGSAIALSLGLIAGPASAASSVTVTTPYPSVEAAAGTKVSLDLIIKGTSSNRVSLNVAGVPSGWSA